MHGPLNVKLVTRTEMTEVFSL